MTAKKQTTYGQLEKSLLAALTEGGEVSAAQLLRSVSTSQNSYTIQAVYHVLRKLRRNGVVVKVRDRFSISIPWALDIIDLGRKLEEKIVFAPSAEQVIPLEGESLELTLSSLLSLDEFWTHLMVLLLGKRTDRTVFNFCPHPWFYFLHRQQLERFYRTLLRRRCRIFVLVGDNQFLDRYFCCQLDERLYRCQTGSGKLVGGTKSRHVMVIGDFIIHVVLNRRTAKSIDALFGRITSTEHREIRLLHHELSSSGNTKLKIVRDSKRAASLRKTFLTIEKEG
jgi:DNA-binding transcriptional ArsR family regulator